MIDTLAAVIAAVNDGLTGAWVGDTMPAETALDAKLPVVLVRDLPGGAADIPWQAAAGPLTDVVDLDIDVYAHTRAETRALARGLRAIFYALPAAGLGVRQVSETSGFARRPDWNTRIVRDGAEYSLRVDAASLKSG